MTACTVAIVIPFHQENITPQEKISIEQCRAILCNYPRFLVVPRGMNVHKFIDVDPDLQVQEFDPDYFTSAVGYNLLCRRAEFYERFIDYEYMLLYQVDSYVFKDQLQEWCGKMYDYVGGPWLNYNFQTTSKKWWVKLPVLRPFLKQVGNGGFSLRRNQIFFDESRRLYGWITKFKSMPEDVFWCNIANRLGARLKIPTTQEAVWFAFDAEPDKCFEITNGKFPFGCHGWNAEYKDYWEEIIYEIHTPKQAGCKQV